jgi:uncharacterized lipoprotein YajG
MKWNIAARAIGTSLSIARLGATLVASAMLFGGCAFTTGHVNVAYEPTTQASRTATAESPRVKVEVTDKRPVRTVGQKINGFGMKTADIVSDNDVVATLRSAFETELQSRGYADGVGGNVVSVSLSNFQNQFTLGFFSGDAVATMGMQVTVKPPNGSIAYDKYITGESKDWIEVAGEDNAQRMLDGAMRDAVAKVFGDNAFIEALNKR